MLWYPPGLYCPWESGSGRKERALSRQEHERYDELFQKYRELQESLLERHSQKYSKDFIYFCFAPEFLDSELSVFMQQLRAQGAAGELGRG